MMKKINPGKRIRLYWARGKQLSSFFCSHSKKNNSIDGKHL